MCSSDLVLKPAELTPLSSLRVAELIAEVGFPPGVVNVLPGVGSVAGQYLAEHEGIQKIAFTGSTPTGRRIVQASAGNLKRVQLELGGKGANIVFPDADMTAAVNGAASMYRLSITASTNPESVAIASSSAAAASDDRICARSWSARMYSRYDATVFGSSSAN